jgi:hypothetical protein
MRKLCHPEWSREMAKLRAIDMAIKRAAAQGPRCQIVPFSPTSQRSAALDPEMDLANHGEASSELVHDVVSQ